MEKSEKSETPGMSATGFFLFPGLFRPSRDEVQKSTPSSFPSNQLVCFFRSKQLRLFLSLCASERASFTSLFWQLSTVAADHVRL